MATATTQSNRPVASPSAAEWIRTFLLVQAATFLLAATAHFGILVQGLEHLQAGIAESVIASVLLAGLIATWVRPAAVRGIGLVAQGFAVAGTLVGLFAIIVGFGPRTAPDYVIHVVMLAELAFGLIVASRVRTSVARSAA
jgi:hypothetical protein